MKIVNRFNTKFVIYGLAAICLLTSTFLAVNAYRSMQTQDEIASRTDTLPRYGVAVGANLLDQSPAEQDKRLATLKTMGAGWVRLDFEWNLIQPTSANEYQWEAYDRLVTLLRKHDFEVLGILDFTPSWARLPACPAAKQCAPARPEEYGRFAGAVASRYKSQDLHYWEIWNEPNTKTFFLPQPDPVRYSRMLAAAHEGIHRANPKAIVITGGTAPSASSNGNISPADFLDAIYNHAGKDAFDAVGAHPYTYPVGPKYLSDHAWAGLSVTAPSLRSIMVARDDKRKKIWLTEFGAPTGGPGALSSLEQPNLEAKPDHVTETLQAAMLHDAFELHDKAPWVGPLIIYTDRDSGSANDTIENFFGLMRTDGSPKPAYETFQNATKK